MQEVREILPPSCITVPVLAGLQKQNTMVSPQLCSALGMVLLIPLAPLTSEISKINKKPKISKAQC